jgi:hypothetical protein
VYSQPIETYRQIEPIRRFLNSALAHDTAAMAMQASNEQPVRWALEATRLDSLAVREWAVSRPRVATVHRGDTLWVTLRRPGSTARCSPLYPLAAGFLQDSAGLRLIHLSSSCPSDHRPSPGDPVPPPGRAPGSTGKELATAYDKEGERLTSAGFTRDELLMKGRLNGKTLTLKCTSQGGSCPDKVMEFRRAP